MENLETLFLSFETGIRSAKATKPKEYLKSIGLDYNELRIGFNSGQFHHRESQRYKDRFEAFRFFTSLHDFLFFLKFYLKQAIRKPFSSIHRLGQGFISTFSFFQPQSFMMILGAYFSS